MNPRTGRGVDARNPDAALTHAAKAAAPHPDLGEPVRGWMLDLRETEALLAWQAVAGRLIEARRRAAGPTSWLLAGSDVGEAALAGPDPHVRHPVETHLPMLLSSTREIDIFGAMVAALPLVATGQGAASSWLCFLTGYACGLRTSPLLDARRRRFLCEFDNAMMVVSTRGGLTHGVENACTESGISWTHLVLQAIGYGNVTLAALLAQRIMSMNPSSDGNTMLGALLGSTLWRDCPSETDLIGRLCNANACFPWSEAAMHGSD
ncbi:hypothetical protein [Castellaniella denitrificans]|uniref:ADP-ribosylglycohydrolase n=1 Tax=Castellaniella denitrificans TaxID=56119 RepID=A0ABT4M4N8_9BURK|nr:hypothetical protein [Castellaniella denitrificans]MCZ4330288.1 hypothetical protein [Castellaniella denitrificans]